METQTSAKQPLWMAGLITQSMSGRPASGLMFFLGMDTEPPRAGIIAITRGLPVAMLAADDSGEMPMQREPQISNQREPSRKLLLRRVCSALSSAGGASL